MKNVLKLDVTNLGFLSSLPYMCMFAVGIATGQAADYARGESSAHTLCRVRKPSGDSLAAAAPPRALALASPRAAAGLLRWL